jgi:uncharacterized protein
MKNIILISFILFTFSFQSNAQDKQADIKTMFELMRSDKMIDAMMENYTNVMKSYMSKNLGDKMDEEQAEKFNAFMDFLNKEMVILSHNLMGDMQELYDKHFSHEEIKQLILFYETEVGQKLLDLTPEISKEIMDITMNKYMPDLQVKIDEYVQTNMSEEEAEEE